MRATEIEDSENTARDGHLTVVPVRLESLT
jgi:hypothetical protein